MSEYVGILVTFLFAGCVSAAMVVLSSKLGRKNPTAAKLEPFECGEKPFALPAGRLAIKFYLTAILFILFDVELVFLYPWAVTFGQLGMTGLAQMGVFLAILMVGYVYAWDNKALEWK